MKHLLIAALLVGSAAAFRVDSVDLTSYSFEAFTKDFEKTYATAEERASREAIFSANLKMINAHNANPNKDYEMSVNRMADFTPSEMQALYGQIPSRTLKSTLKHTRTTSKTPKADLPPSIDWREKGAVTPVKNQGGCGSCWAFAAVETMESHWAIKTGQLLELSTQQVTSCTPNPRECGGTGGCKGAIENLAFEYVIDAGGIVLEKDFPYKAIDSNCGQLPNRAPRVANFSSIVLVNENDQDDMLETVATKGPVTIGVWATPMQFYSRGIFSGCDYTKNMNINHAVQLVGYGTEAGKDYWIVRNSWGSSWGEGGYIRLLRESEAKCGINSTPQDGSACKDDPMTPVKVCGQCGMLSESSYPIAKH